MDARMGWMDLRGNETWAKLNRVAMIEALGDWRLICLLS